MAVIRDTSRQTHSASTPVSVSAVNVASQKEKEPDIKKEHVSSSSMMNHHVREVPTISRSDSFFGSHGLSTTVPQKRQQLLSPSVIPSDLVRGQTLQDNRIHPQNLQQLGRSSNRNSSTGSSSNNTIQNHYDDNSSPSFYSSKNPMDDVDRPEEDDGDNDDDDCFEMDNEGVDNHSLYHNPNDHAAYQNEHNHLYHQPLADEADDSQDYNNNNAYSPNDDHVDNHNSDDYNEGTNGEDDYNFTAEEYINFYNDEHAAYQEEQNIMYQQELMYQDHYPDMYARVDDEVQDEENPYYYEYE